MQRSRIVVPVVGFVALIVLALLALSQWSAARKAEAKLAEAQLRVAQLEQRSGVSAATAGVDAPAPPAPTAASAMAERAEAAAPRDRGGRRWERMADLSSDPEIAPLVLKQRQRQMAKRYAALVAKLGLTGEQATRLASLLAEREMSEGDAWRLARLQRLGRDEARDLAQEAGADTSDALQTLLGAAGFAQLQDYDRTYGERSTVTSLAQQLAQTGTPLSAQQQEQLIAVLAQNPAVAATGDAPPGRGPGGGGAAFASFRPDASAAEVEAALVRKTAADAAALASAAAFLTPAQLESLRASQEASTDDLRLAALRMERFRAMREGR